MIRYLLILTVSLMPLTSLACSCHLGSPKEKFEMFDSVFVGKVVDIQQKGTTNQFNEAEVLVNVQQIMRFKGKDEDIKVVAWIPTKPPPLTKSLKLEAKASKVKFLRSER